MFVQRMVYMLFDHMFATDPKDARGMAALETLRPQ